jgi:hypothetical protein
MAAAACLLAHSSAEAQQRTPGAMFGVQAKPVIPFQFFETVSTASTSDLSAEVRLEGGFAFGMSVRAHITPAIAIETGIGQINRRYGFTIRNDTTGYEGSNVVRYTGYEIPVSGLFQVRLGELTWMSGSLGGSFDFFPSDAQKDVQEGRIYVFRNRWIQAGLLGNLGFEYRGEKSGTFYIGATYHRPFTPMATADLTWYTPSFFPHTMRTELDGGYLTLDLRYYFPDESMRRRSRW